MDFYLEVFENRLLDFVVLRNFFCSNVICDGTNQFYLISFKCWWHVSAKTIFSIFYFCPIWKIGHIGAKKKLLLLKIVYLINYFFSIQIYSLFFSLCV